MKKKPLKTNVKSAHSVQGSSLTMCQLKQKAISVGVQSDQMNKTDLIRSIQKAEGYTPCFDKSNGQCLHTDCCFMDDCLTVKC